MSNVKNQNHNVNVKTIVYSCGVKSNNIRHRAYYFSLDIMKFAAGLLKLKGKKF